jgi:hypothetical protein
VTHPDEEVVRRYFELQGYFVRTNIVYAFRTDRGMGWSDVDLCILHPRTSDAAAVEVKGWHTGATSVGTLRSEPSLFYFMRDEANRAVAELLGRVDFRHVLVVGRITEPRAAVKEACAERGVELLDFPEVLQFVIDSTTRNQNAASDAEHAIRLLKVYGYLT